MPNYASGPISSFTEKVPVSTDYLPIVDTTDPFVKNKKATVGNLFKGVPYSAGNTDPAIQFGSSNYSGIFSPNSTQVGVRVGGSSNLNVIQTAGAISLSVTDNSVSARDLTLQAYGSGKINFNSIVNFTDNNFSLSSSSNSSNTVSFNLSSVSGSNVLSVPNGSGTIVTDIANQTLSNKTLSSPTFTGLFAVNAATSDLIVTNGKVGIGIASPDYKLHVSNDVKVSGLTPNIRFTSSSSEYQLINTGNNLRVYLNGTDVGVGFYGSGLSVNNILYQNNLNILGSGTTYVTINSSGNIGVGNTNAQQKLHVTGSAIISGGLYRPDNSTLLMSYDSATNYFYSNQDFRTGPASTSPNVIITSLGSVGIGKSTPTVPLDVVGRIRNTGVLYTSSLGRKIVTNPLSGGVLSIDFDSGAVYSFLLNQNINTINYTYSKGTPDSNTSIEIVLYISHDGNPYSINWTNRILWIPAGGYGSGITASLTAPTLQTAGPGGGGNPSKDVITLTSYDGGTTFLGRYVAAIPAS